MSKASEMLEERVLGPKGGDVEHPMYKPASRDAPLNARVDPATGLPGLHRKFHETAVLGRDKEPAWARMAAFMLLQGRTNSEIGMAANVTPYAVSHMRAQRWFQELLATLANEDGEAGLGLLRSEALASIQKIVEIRDESESERVALAAAIFIVEQVQGKAVQRNMNVNANTTFSSPDAEMKSIGEQLAALRAARQQPTQPQVPSEPEQTSIT